VEFALERLSPRLKERAHEKWRKEEKIDGLYNSEWKAYVEVRRRCL